MFMEIDISNKHRSWKPAKEEENINRQTNDLVEAFLNADRSTCTRSSSELCFLQI